MQPAKRHSAIVVGAGPGGLAAAMLLAAQGADVTVYEKDELVGGRTKTLLADGYRFDIGPTFFLYPQILEGLFARCGLKLADYVELRRVDPNYRLIFEEGPQIHVSSDIAKLEGEIAKLNPRDATAIRRFITRNQAKLKAFTPILQRPFSSLLDYLAPDVLKALKPLLPLGSVDGELRRYFRDPRVRLAFSFQTKYLGMSPFRCPNLFTFLAYLEYEFGIWHPVGGCGAVSEGMARAAADLGAKIHCQTPIKRVVVEKGRAVGVEMAHETHFADAIILNADFAQAMTELVPSSARKSWNDARIESKRYSCSTFMLYLGVEGEYDVDHHNIFLSKDYEQNIAEIESGECVPATPSLYVANPARTDRSFASAGGSSLYVLVPVGHCGKIDWLREKAAFREKILARLEGFGFANLRQRIRYERCLTPEDWRDQFAIYRGATFNLAHTLGQMLYFRPHNRFEDIEGLYLVGGGTHPGSGLPVIYEGAQITSDLILKEWDRV